MRAKLRRIERLTHVSRGNSCSRAGSLMASEMARRAMLASSLAAEGLGGGRRAARHQLGIKARTYGSLALASERGIVCYSASAPVGPKRAGQITHETRSALGGRRAVGGGGRRSTSQKAHVACSRSGQPLFKLVTGEPVYRRPRRLTVHRMRAQVELSSKHRSAMRVA